MKPIVPLFEQNAGASFERATKIFRMRGEQYGDTWAHCQHLTLRAVLKELLGVENIDIEFCRALASAVLVDVKHQRLEGGWNEDHADDGINYTAFLAEQMRKIKGLLSQGLIAAAIPPAGRSV